MDKSTPILVLFSVIVLFLSGCLPQMQRQTRVMMGTYVEVVSDDSRAAGIVFDEIARIEKLLSKYDPESEISRLNRDGRLQASAETWFIMNKAREFWEASGGAFDVTVGPLMDIWGFTDKKFRVPSDQEIAAAIELVGMDKIVFHQQDSVLELSVSGMKIDLGAIAKGYAVDCAVARLKAAGVNSCLINAGGQVYALGTKEGRPWQVAVRDPRGRGVREHIRLADRSVSTSGDYEQYFSAQGRRFGHIMDPRRAAPVSNGLLSVTVTAADGLTADALSTAAIVLGKDQAELLIGKFPGASASFLESKDHQGHGL